MFNPAMLPLGAARMFGASPSEEEQMLQNNPMQPQLNPAAAAGPVQQEEAPQLPPAPPVAQARPTPYFKRPEAAEGLLMAGGALLSGAKVGDGLAILGQHMGQARRDNLQQEQINMLNMNRQEQLEIMRERANAARNTSQSNILAARQSLLATIARQGESLEEKQQVYMQIIQNPEAFGFSPEIVQGMPLEYTPQMDMVGQVAGMSAYQQEALDLRRRGQDNTRDYQSQSLDIRRDNSQETQRNNAWRRGVEGARYGVQYDDPQQDPRNVGIPAAPPQVASQGAPSGNPLNPPAGGSRQPIGIRNNNHGNIKDGDYARSQPGYIGSNGGFAVFETPEQGIAAQENLLRRSYVGKGFNTISSIVNKYAPVGKENSQDSVNNYIRYIAQRTGIDPSQPIDPSMVPQVAAAMREFENGQTVRTGGQTPAARPQTRGGRTSYNGISVNPQAQVGYQAPKAPVTKVIGNTVYIQNPETGKWYIRP